MNWSARRINLLADKLSARKYLEIGVEKGETFTDIRITERTAVDPAFAFDTTALANANTHFHQKPSDQFFAEISGNSLFDLIFIDGLHQFEQVVRDFSNAIIHSHSGSVIVLDDTKPIDIFSANPNRDDAIRFRRRTGVEDAAWHGDVYKIVFYLHDFWPALSYRTIVGSGNPQTFVWRSSNFTRKPRFNSLESISRLTYYELMDNIDLLRECDEGAAIAEISAALLR
jgi:hypothetical protein